MERLDPLACLFANPSITDEVELDKRMTDLRSGVVYGEDSEWQWERRREIFGVTFDIEYQLEAQ